MRVLVLGGSAFLGRAVVELALARGHAVTTFNRGRTGRDVPGVEAVRGDRTVPADVARLVAAGPWDLAVDTCGYVPAVVRHNAQSLAGCVGRYVYVSSVSVYAGWPAEALDESAPVHDGAPDATDGEYGQRKAGAERAVVEAFGDRALLARAGLLLGPHENVGRLPWWLRRTARGGDVLAPGRPDRPIQVVDVRDVADFFLDADVPGPVNVTSPPGSSTYGEMLRTCVDVTGSDARLVWVDDDVLTAHGVEPWTELPLWAPETAEYAGIWAAAAERARAAGLRPRPLAATVADTWAALQSEELPAAPGALPPHGIDPAKERAVLDAWTPSGPGRPGGKPPR